MSTKSASPPSPGPKPSSRKNPPSTPKSLASGSLSSRVKSLICLDGSSGRVVPFVRSLICREHLITMLLDKLANYLLGEYYMYCLSRQWDGSPLGLGLVVEDAPTELSCTCMYK